MKNSMHLTVSVLALAITMAGFAWAEDTAGATRKDNKPAASQPASPAAAVDLNNTVCPVSLDKVGDSKLTETYDGKIYHFCCDGCPDDFKKDPAKFAKAVAADPAKYGVKTTK